MQHNENNVNLTTNMGITCSSRGCFERRHTRTFFFVFHVFAKKRVTKATICFFYLFVWKLSHHFVLSFSVPVQSPRCFFLTVVCGQFANQCPHSPKGQWAFSTAFPTCGSSASIVHCLDCRLSSTGKGFEDDCNHRRQLSSVHDYVQRWLIAWRTCRDVHHVS